MRLRGGHARPQRDARAHAVQRDLRDRDGGKDGARVEVAQMADAERPARERSEARAEEGVVTRAGKGDHLARIHAFGRTDRGDGVRRDGGAFGHGLETPGRYGGAHGSGQVAVAGEDGGHAFLGQPVERRAQAVQDRGRGRVGERSRLMRRQQRLDIKVGARALRGLDGRHPLGAEREDAEARGRHQALLAAGDGQVDAPGVHLEGQRGDGGHAVHEQQRLVHGRVHLAPHGRDVRGDAGRGLVMGDEDGLDLAVAVAAETAAEFRRGAGRAPGHVDDLDLKAHAFRHLGPERREGAVPRHQHLVAGRQRVGDRRFPGRRARARDQRDARRRAAEDGGHVAQERAHERGEFGRAVVRHRDRHRAADALGQVGGAGDEEMGKADGHGVLLGLQTRCQTAPDAAKENRVPL
jgi:hypothetical protein